MAGLRRRLFAIVLAFCAAAPAAAATFLPVTFSELITRADLIFVGEVADVRPFPLQTRDGTIVKTRVVFRVSDPIFGTASAFESFDFLGGEWDGLLMRVEGMPTFAVGDRRLVFARRERSINPIVGFTQGLLRVSRDARGVEQVSTLARVPVAELSEFRARVSRALVEARRQ